MSDDKGKSISLYISQDTRERLDGILSQIPPAFNTKDSSLALTGVKLLEAYAAGYMQFITPDIELQYVENDTNLFLLKRMNNGE